MKISPFGFWWILGRRKVMEVIIQNRVPWFLQMDRWERQKQGHFPFWDSEESTPEDTPYIIWNMTLAWSKCWDVFRQQETLSEATQGLSVLPGEVRGVQKFLLPCWLIWKQWIVPWAVGRPWPRGPVAIPARPQRTMLCWWELMWVKSARRSTSSEQIKRKQTVNSPSCWLQLWAWAGRTLARWEETTMLQEAHEDVKRGPKTHTQLWGLPHHHHPCHVYRHCLGSRSGKGGAQKAWGSTCRKTFTTEERLF